MKEEHLITDSDDRDEKTIAPTVPPSVRKRGVRRTKRKSGKKRIYAVKEGGLAWQLRAYREHKGLTVEKLAEKAEVKVSTIRKLEREDDRDIPIQIITKILRKMNLKLSIVPR